MPKKIKHKLILTDETVISKIYMIRGEKVMLDKHLSELYGVSTGNLNKAVKRNFKRFPADFMFQLNKEENSSLIFQIGTSKRGGTRKYPFAFTEQGVAMLSGILNSDRAINVNIQIMRIYTRIRQMLLTHKDLLLKIEELERKYAEHDEKIIALFKYLKEMIVQKNEPLNPIGFRLPKVDSKI